MKELTHLKRWRVNQPMTQRALAARLGVSVPTIHVWEKTQVPAARVPEVSQITGLTWCELRPIECERKPAREGSAA